MNSGYENKNLIRKGQNNKVLEFGKDIKISGPAIIYGPMLRLVEKNYNNFKKILNEERFHHTNIDRVLDSFTKYFNTTVIIDDAWLNINKPSDLSLLG